MTIIDIIGHKRDGYELSKEEINYWIDYMMSGEIADYQVSSLLMAIVLNGMSFDETFYLTEAMVNSGEIIDLSGIDGIKVDKHSTGGVGDKVTPILVPLLATFNLKVAKMSGRGLGHTGGTIDKLEAIPGYNAELSREDFINQINTVGAAVISQTGNLVPADKKLYALRDTTGTVSSIPLIASSIMSKKIASGADLIVLDVKIGDGALVNTIEEARELSTFMIEIGKRFNKKVMCMLTNMDEPLGYAIGNALEIKEAVDTLNGNGPSDVMEVIIKTASLMVSSAQGISEEEAKVACFKNINNGDAYTKFIEMVSAQGGRYEEMEFSNRVIAIRSTKAGYLYKINTTDLGELARIIGAGRLKKEDIIRYKAGIVLSVKVGDYVEAGAELAKVYLEDLDARLNDFIECFVIEEEAPIKKPLIYEIIK